MKISAVYIAKNEESNIARSLESVKNSVDELILVDTGSTDATMDIFRSYGGQVYQQAWQDDFSAPRNLAISKATGDWLILLDADEYFSEETANNLRKIIAENQQYSGLLVKIVNIERKDKTVLDEFYNLRIVKNIPGIYYRGRIHENIVFEKCLSDTDIKRARIADNLLKIYHTGYSSEINIEKGKRNIKILLEELKNGRPVEEVYIHLADAYREIDEEKSLYYAQMDIDLGRRNITYGSRSYRKLIEYSAKHDKSQERLELLKKAVAEYPELPEFHAEYGEALLQCYQYSEAVKEFQLTKEIAVNYNGIEFSKFDINMLKILTKRQKFAEEMMNKVKKIKISACLICKNEEKNIEAWLDNVENFADEIIIVDTGSTDSTLDILKARQIKYYELVWKNDFSYARNYALEKATGDWIVFTDADELFVNPENIRGFLTDVKKVIQVVMLPIANLDKTEYHRFQAMRIMRNIRELRYKNKIHETLFLTTGEPLEVYSADERLLINHTGYQAVNQLEKLQRNLELLQDEIAEEGLQEKHYRYLADCYYGLEDYVQALKYSILAIDSTMQAIGSHSDMYWIAIHCFNKLEYSIEEQSAFMDLAINQYPQLGDFYALKGLFILREKAFPDKTEAVELLLNSIDKARKHANNHTENEIKEASHYLEIYEKVLCGLGLIMPVENAREYYLEVLKLNKWNDEALIGLAESYDKENYEELFIYLNENYSDDNEKKLLGKLYNNNGLIDIALKLLGNNTIIQYENMIRGNLASVMNMELKETVADLQKLFASLLKIEPKFRDYTYNSQLELLPKSLKTIINKFHSENGYINDEELSDYLSMLSAVIRLVPDCLERYVEIASQISVDNVLILAGKLVEYERFGEALSLYDMIPADSPYADEIFWGKTGICFYRMGEYAIASECFLKANTNDNEIRSYIKWCQEVNK
jgi:glycosyltransferase involved in cell wall biosynthesis